MFLERLEYGTARLMGMGAVGEAAVFREPEDLGEIAGNLLGLHVEGAEALNPRGIDEPTFSAGARPRGKVLKGNHLGKGGGMLAHVMGVGNLRGAEVGPRHQTVDDRRLAHAAIAAEQGDLPIEQRAQGIEPFACLGRDLVTSIADGLIEIHHRLLIAPHVGIEDIRLVEHQDHGHAISLGRSQETVDEGGGSLGVDNGNHEDSLIDIGRNDVTLLGEVDALADDVVAAILNLGDEGDPLAASSRRDDDDPVAYGYGIRAADALQAEVTLDLTINQLAIVRKDGVPTACILNDKSLHNKDVPACTAGTTIYTVMISLFLAAIKSSIFLMYLS